MYKDFTKSEKREVRHRKRMPVHGKNLVTVYTNAVMKRYNRVVKKSPNFNE